MLAQAEVEALDEGGIDLPAAGRQHLLHRLQGAKHDPMPHADQASPAHRLDDLRIAQLGAGPVAWRRSGWTHCPQWVRSAVAYSLKPSVRKSGTQPGASTWTTWWTTRCAMASVRSPTSMVSSSLVTGSIAAQTQWGERDRRVMASTSLTAPAFTALSSAKSSSSWTCATRTSCKKYREKAMAWSATSTNHARTVLGSTSNTRATARMPSPSANAPTAHTSRSGGTRLPCNLALILPRPTQL